MERFELSANNYSELFNQNIANPVKPVNPYIKKYPFQLLSLYFLDNESIQHLKYGTIHNIKMELAKFSTNGDFNPLFKRNESFIYLSYLYNSKVTNYNLHEKTQLIIKNEEQYFIDFLFSHLEKKLVAKYNSFRTEVILCDNRYDYINSNVAFILNDFQNLNSNLYKSKNKLSKIGLLIREKFINVFEYIFRFYFEYLSEVNFKSANEILNPTYRNIHSFQLKKHFTEEQLDNAVSQTFDKLALYGFLDADRNDFIDLKELFLNKKRNTPQLLWKDSLTSLHTFIKILMKRKIIQDTKNKHWEIVSDFFILPNDRSFDTSEIKNLKMSKHFDTNAKLDLAITPLFSHF